MEENKQPRPRKRSSINLALLIAFAACVASIVSAFTSYQSSREAIRVNRINQKPSVIFELVQNPTGWASKTHALLSYKMINTGAGPALNIHRRYISYLVMKDGSETLVQDCPNDLIYDLLPTQHSPTNPDHINISGFDFAKVSKIKVNLKATYHGDQEIDKNTYYSEVLFLLHPMKQNETITFLVTQRESKYGIENKK